MARGSSSSHGKRLVDRAQQPPHARDEVLFDEEAPERPLGVVGRGGEEVELDDAVLVGLADHLEHRESLRVAVLVVVAHDALAPRVLAVGVDQAERPVEDARPPVDLAGSAGDGATGQRRGDLAQVLGVDELHAPGASGPIQCVRRRSTCTVAARAAGAYPKRP